MRVIINADLAADLLHYDETGDQRLLYNEIVLSQAAEGNIHILVALGKNIDAALIVTVILVPVNRIRRKRLKVSVIIFDTSFINNDFTINNHYFTNISLWIQSISTGNGDIRIDRSSSFPKTGVQDLSMKPFTGVFLSKLNDPGFFHRLFGKISSKGSLTGAGDTKIDV